MRVPPRVKGVCTHAGSGPSRVRRRLLEPCLRDPTGQLLYKHILSCVFQYCGGFLHCSSSVFCKALLLASELPSTSGFDCELEFFIVWLNQECSSQLSGIVEFWFLDDPSLFCSFFFLAIGHTRPHIWPYVVRTRSILFSCKSHPGPWKSVRWAFRSIRWILWSLSVHPIILFLHPRSSNHQYVFPAIHQVTYEWFW